MHQANNIIHKCEEANKITETFSKIELIQLKETDFVDFTSNLQLLDDETLQIP